MALEYFDGIKRGVVDRVLTFQLRDGPEERIISGGWEFPVSLFKDVGYDRSQIVEGLEFQYLTRQLRGEPLRFSNFGGILPPVELIVQ